MESFFCSLVIVCAVTSVSCAVTKRSQLGCYPELSNQHSGCLREQQCAPGSYTSISENDQRLILSIHNELRRRLTRKRPPNLGQVLLFAIDGLTASNMLELTWDEELAAIAQNWAQQCIKRSDCQECRRIYRFPVGQNAYFATSTETKGSPDWPAALQHWTRGWTDLNAGLVNSYSFDQKWGSFSQVVWAQTYKIGCGFAKEIVDGKAHFYYICNYGPAGNILGQALYKSGIPCSACPEGFKGCSNGLCRGNPSNPGTFSTQPGPVPTPAEPSTVECEGELACVKKESVDQLCDLTKVLGQFGGLSPTCPTGQQCCALKNRDVCPSTHACVPTLPTTYYYDNYCNKSSIIPSISGCASNAVCCKLVSGPILNPSVPPTKVACKYNCVEGESATLCQAFNDVDTDAVCPGQNTVCCKTGDLTTVSPTANPTIATPAPTELPTAPTLPPASCEKSGGLCQAEYLKFECNGRRQIFNSFSCPDPLICCIDRSLALSIIDKDAPKSLRTKTACGIPKSGLQAVTNQISTPGNWCWVVDIVDQDGKFLCHGALIDTELVTTTASCFSASKSAQTYIKFPNRTDKFLIRTAVNHVDFNVTTYDRDLALIRLNQPIDLEKTGACLVCIPLKGPTVWKTSVLLLSSRKENGEFGPIVTQRTVALANEDECKSTYGSPSIPMDSVCISVGNSGCAGKGAPVVFEDNGYYFLGGHLSFSSEYCFNKLRSAVFSHISEEWATYFIRTTNAVFERDNPTTGGGKLDTNPGTKTCDEVPRIQNGFFAIISCEAEDLTTLSAGFRIINRTDCFSGTSGRLKIGTKVQYGCNPFYELQGDVYQTCKEDGSWGRFQRFCQPDCGKKFDEQTTLISRGNSSSGVSWPWMAALYDLASKEIFCGGALIKTNYVLTAAHCLVGARGQLNYYPDSFDIMVGKIYRNILKDDNEVQRMKVAKVSAYASYNALTQDSDIALIKLKRHAVLTERVQVVCLPSRDDISESFLVDGNRGTVAGWGRNEFGLLSEKLAFVELPVYPIHQCRREIQQSQPTAIITQLTDQMYCAGYGRNSSVKEYTNVCKGDSGGPMVFRGADSRWTVQGIVSFYLNRKECQDQRPEDYTFFTKVQKFSGWIELTTTEA